MENFVLKPKLIVWYLNLHYCKDNITKTAIKKSFLDGWLVGVI